MKLTKILTLAVIVLCMPLAALADSATFLNNDGTITASDHGKDLTLTGSTLAGISGLPNSAYDCPPPACSGTVSFTTGATLTSGSILSGTATFGAGGSFMVTSGTGPGGLTFSGTFSSATWVESTVNGLNYWTFTGSIVNGMLTEGGVTMKDINGATIELTTLGGGPTVNSGGFNQWTDSGGTSTLNLPLAPVPEPGTLTLLGSGLVCIGMFARRRLSKKSTLSE
ncbi:MAG: PEP-CTERM sorting domain-containing protein [Candidatus Sulfotelmatobacter sp.]